MASIPPRHPLYAVSQAYRRSLVRLWTERLRQIEGRLNPGRGLRWDQQRAEAATLPGPGHFDDDGGSGASRGVAGGKISAGALPPSAR